MSLGLAVIVALLLPATGSALGTGTIKGKVTDAVSNAGIGGVEVCAYELPELETWKCIFETNAEGEYTLSGLSTASYLVEFWAGDLGYQTQYYNDVSNYEDGTPVLVTSSEPVSGIDGHLSKPAVVVPPVIPVVPAVQIPTILPIPAPQPPKPTALHCKKGFKKTTRHGKKACVKIKHHKKHH